MHYELWALNTGNLICDYDTEAEALAMAQNLLAGGWSPDHLGLRLEFDEGDEGDDAQLPPSLYGASLSARLMDAVRQAAVANVPELAAMTPSGRNVDQGIASTPGVVGGSACIVKTRIPVWLLEQMRRLGMADETLLDAYPSLRAEDLVNAWRYVSLHRDEIDREIAENEEAEAA